MNHRSALGFVRFLQIKGSASTWISGWRFRAQSLGLCVAGGGGGGLCACWWDSFEPVRRLQSSIFKAWSLRALFSNSGVVFSTFGLVCRCVVSG